MYNLSLEGGNSKLKYLIEAKNEEELKSALEGMDLNIDQVKYKFLEGEEATKYGYESICLVEEIAPDRAAMLTRRLLYTMGFKAKVKAVEYEDVLTIEIEGEDLAPLIGVKGKTLSSFELILNTIVNKSALIKKKVRLDIAGYRKRREERLKDIARRAADRAKREKRPVQLDVMPSYERRIIHSFAQGIDGVTTKSEGEEPERKVVIYPKT